MTVHHGWIGYAIQTPTWWYTSTLHNKMINITVLTSDQDYGIMTHYWNIGYAIQTSTHHRKRKIQSTIMWLHILISDNNLTAQTSKVDLDKIDTNLRMSHDGQWDTGPHLCQTINNHRERSSYATSLFRYASFTNEMKNDCELLVIFFKMSPFRRTLHFETIAHNLVPDWNDKSSSMQAMDWCRKTGMPWPEKNWQSSLTCLSITRSQQIKWWHAHHPDHLWVTRS